jgi:hypothetical protein
MPKRTRNLQLAEFYRSRPCVVCGKRYGTVGDHIKTFGSGGECCHENLWSLCPFHHLEKGNIGTQSFIGKYPQLIPHLKSKGWEKDEFTGKWIRITEKGWDD